MYGFLVRDNAQIWDGVSVLGFGIIELSYIEEINKKTNKLLISQEPSILL